MSERDPNVSVHAVPEFQIGGRPAEPRWDHSLGRYVYPAAPALGQAFDAITTSVGIKRGYVEGNPVAAHLTGNATVWYAAKLGVGLAIGVAVKKLGDRGHVRSAKTLSVLTTFLGLVPGLLNVKTMSEGRR